MRETSVYLTEEEVESLRHAAIATGISQSELIREGIRRVVASHGEWRRTLHSMGLGSGPADASRHWTPAEVFEKTRGLR